MNDILSQSLTPPAQVLPEITPTEKDRDTEFYLDYYKALDAVQIEAEVRKFQNLEPETLSKDALHRALALMRLHRRTTSGPPKGKTKAASVDAESLL